MSILQEQPIIDKPTSNPPRYRAGLPPIPPRILRLPVERGYPVPWFVAHIEKEGKGEWDFRIMNPNMLMLAIKQKLCWVCGERLSGRGESDPTFTIGPMCAINRTSAEPPSHLECATFSALACPFLTQKQSERRTTGLPDTKQPAGLMIERQPGVVLLWQTKEWQIFRSHAHNKGILFKIGEPSAVKWYREGRAATRDEILESINSGYPLLQDMCDREPTPKRRIEAMQQLEVCRSRALELLPA